MKNLRVRWALLLSLLIALGLRAGLLEQQGLWVDEVFSLSIATGHSLEHSAEEADASLGDFVEPREGVPARTFQRYMQHEEPPASLGRVVRAVLLSDTSPPLYYLVVYFWARLLGTGDVSLRGFSLVCALACVPLMWKVGRELGGVRTAMVSAFLFSVVPIGVYYSTEGRMYSMVWLLSLILASTTLAAVKGQGPRRLFLIWGVVGGLGLVTHYFFAFVWAALGAWLIFRLRSRFSLLAVVTSLCVCLPWYVFLPQTLSRSRLTEGWLAGPLLPTEAATAPLRFLWTYFSGGVHWQAWGPFSGRFPLDLLVLFLVLVSVGLALWRAPRWMIEGQRGLLWLWLSGALVGPVVFDLLQGTHASLVTRYALAGLPAAVLLLATALSAIPSVSRAFLVAAFVVVWAPANLALYERASRSDRPFRETAELISRWLGPRDLILMHSIPSGVLGLARYLPPEANIAAWVAQLEQRTMPQSLETLVSGHERVGLVAIKTVGARVPTRKWLRQNGRRLTGLAGADVFVPRQANTFSTSAATEK